MKTRMSGDDIAVMVKNLKSEIGQHRVSNVYDVDGGKIYMLKLTTTGSSVKKYLLLESGLRFHTTLYARNKPKIPSQFTMKLRKHIRTKRLTGIQQLGDGDRVVDFMFGEGETYGFHLIVEFYASGNIILTDYHYNILSLLRVHKYHEEEVRIAVNQIYPIQGVTTVSVREPKTSTELHSWMKSECSDTGKTATKKLTLKQILMKPGSSFEHLGVSLVEHCIALAGLRASRKLNRITETNSDLGISVEEVEKLLSALETAKALFSQLYDPKVPCTNGFIIVKINEEVAEESTNTDSNKMQDAEDLKTLDVCIPNEDATTTVPTLISRLTYVDFVPVLYAHHVGKPYIKFDYFAEAVDAYFSKGETKKAQTQKSVAKTAAQKKIDKIQADQDARLKALRDLQENSHRQAQLVELNRDDIENVLTVIRSALSSGMDWDELRNLVKMEQKNGNPVASLIHQINFEKNSVDVIMMQDDNDDADGDALVDIVSIDIAKSALANARDLYTRKKKSSKKEQKTLEATQKVLQVAKKKAEKSKDKQDLVPSIHVMRKVSWWEKFHWFITSENFLVIAGHDMQQNETLVKRYMRKGDVYVHADIHGAASCIIRNTHPDRKIPQLSLEQAGTMTVCRSAAWTSHVVTSAWWVYHHQVSKTAPTGEYLTTGSFMIRGKKNFIAPARLEMGLAVLFRVDESCVGRHIGERKPRCETELLEDFVEEEEQTIPPEQRLRRFERTKIKKDLNEEALELKIAAESLAQANISAEDVDVDIEDHQLDDVQEVELKEAAVTDASSTKKRLSAKERRALKKDGEVKSNTAEKSMKTTTKDAKPQKSLKDLSRGERRKLKKIKKKYADQDEEDRSLIMQALGNPELMKKKKEDEAKKEDEKKEEVRPKKDRQAEREIKKIMEEENIIEIPDEEKYDHLDMFTGLPQSEDILQYAVVVCAPYPAVTNYKYRVKLLPGSQKKGKACKEAMHLFMSSKTTSDVEKGIMKCITDNEMVAACLPKVKVSAPGLHASKAKSKKKGKK